MKFYIINNETVETKEVTFEELAAMLADENFFLTLTEVKVDSMTYVICPCGYNM